MNAHNIGVARGALSARAPPREDIFGPNLQGKVVSAPPGIECTPEAKQDFNFWRKLGRFRRWKRLFRQF